MDTVISDSYNSLEETLNHLKSLKLKIYVGQNVADCCAKIFVDYENPVCYGAFKTKNLSYITHIFEDTSDYRFSLWYINKYKEVADFINKLCVCDLDVLQQEDIINYN